MSHVVITWELGSHLGHIVRLLPLALKLRESGHDVSFILKDLSRACTLFVKHGFPVYQAPIWLQGLKDVKSPPANYAEILILHGYLSEEGLSGMVAGWRNLYHKLKPDLVLFDHSPTALLAASDQPFRKALFGNGFTHPPHTDPMPCFRPDENIPPQRLALSEERVLTTVNKILEKNHIEPRTHLYNLFDVDEDFLLTFPELDHYSRRTGAKYWGPLMPNDSSLAPVWPQIDSRPRVFAYLKSEYGNVQSVLEAIASTGANTLIYSSNMPGETVNKFSGHNIRFSRKPYDIRTVARQCDLAICHAGHDTTATVLLAGKPLLLLPMQQEQTLLSRNVAKLGAGLIGFSDSKPEDYQQQMQQLLDSTRYRESARQFSTRYTGTQRENALHSVLKRCLELLQ